MKKPSIFGMAKSLAPVLGVPPDFFDLIDKIKVKDFSFDPDEESLTVYGQIAVKDKESLDALVKFASMAMDMLKRVNEDEQKEAA